jgi:hypothetical protein
MSIASPALANTGTAAMPGHLLPSLTGMSSLVLAALFSSGADL